MFISLDLETTGFDPEKDDIIEFGAIKFDLNGNKETLQFLAKPRIKIPSIVKIITKITDEMVVDAVLFADKADEVKAFIGDLPIIGHNISFDTGFLKAKGIPLTNPEYDTHILAGMLLQNLPSYSLEVISHTLGLSHAEKHRALDDSIAAMELFVELVKRFEALPQTLLDQIHELCGRSNWDLKDFICSLKHKAQHFPPISPYTIIKPGKTNSEKILEEKANFLFEELPPHEDLMIDMTLKAEPETYIAVPYHFFRKIEASLPDTISKIDSYDNYISLARLEEFTKQEHYTDGEISALIKYLIWKDQTETGLLSEVRVTGEENKTLSKVSVDENIKNPKEEFFIKKALEKDDQNATICTHQYLLDGELPTDHKLILFYPEEFNKTLRRKYSLYITLEYFVAPLNTIQTLHKEDATCQALIEKSEMLFGLLESLFDKFNDKNEYGAQCNITNAIKSNQSWVNAAELVKTLITMSHELGKLKTDQTIIELQKWKKNLEEIHNFFFVEKTWTKLSWMEVRERSKAIVLRQVPKSVTEEFKNLLAQFTEYKVIGENLEETLEELELESEIVCYSQKAENLEICISTDDEMSDPELAGFIKDYITENPQPMAVIFNSKKTLQNFTIDADELKIPCLSQTLGSTGKLKEQFRQQSEAGNSIVVAMTPNIWKGFEYQDRAETLIIHKLPFDPPNNIELVIKSENKNNPFMDVFLPKAIKSLQEMINRFRHTGPQTKKIIILDSRLTQKDYGRHIIAELEKLAQVTKVSLASL